MLAADTAVQHGVFLPAFGYSHLHQLAYTGLVKFAEGIELINFLIVIGFQEFSCIVTGEAKGHLGQVVGAKAEEIGFLGHFVRGQGCPGNFDHGAYFIVNEVTLFLHNLFRSLHNDILNEQQLLAVPDQGYHDFRNDVVIHFLLYRNGRFNDGPGLHPGNFRIDDA